MTNLGSIRISYGLLWLSVFVLPWEEVWVAFGSFGTIGLLSVALTFVVAVFSLLMGEKLKPLNPLLLVVAFFIFWGGCTILWSVNPSLGVMRLLNYLARFTFIWLIWQTVRSPKDVFNLMEAYLWGCFVLGLFTLDNYFWGMQRNYGRYSPSDIDPNYMAFTIALALPMFVCLMKQVISFRKRLLYITLMAVGVVAILLSGSRGGFVALMIGALLSAMLFQREVFQHKIIMIAVFCLLGIGIFQYMEPLAPSVERLLNIGEELLSGDWSRRFDVWDTGLTIFVNNMFWGVGLQGFSTAIGSYSTSVSGFYAHNTYLTILVEQGAIGFFNFLCIMLVLLMAIKRMPSSEKKAMLALLIVWAAGSYVLNWDHHRATWFIWGIIAAYAGLGPFTIGQRSQID